MQRKQADSLVLMLQEAGRRLLLSSPNKFLTLEHSRLETVFV